MAVAILLNLTLLEQGNLIYIKAGFISFAVVNPAH
jgi:hypothetical protein